MVGIGKEKLFCNKGIKVGLIFGRPRSVGLFHMKIFWDNSLGML